MVCIAFTILFSALTWPVHNLEVYSSTSYGPVMGEYIQVESTSAEVYESIRYAAAPIGSLRFELPVPPSPWVYPEDVRFETSCHQLSLNQEITDAQYHIFGYDDCLRLKIVVPVDQNGQRFSEYMPIIFWIHGGSYRAGGKLWYKNSGIIRHFSSKKIIFAAVDFRQGFQGFLSLQDNEIPGNLGVEDVIFALKFMRENAYSFGGDPGNIILAGESSGAAIAGIIATSPKTSGLATGLMQFSGTATAPWAVKIDETTKNTLRVISHCNCSRENSGDIKQCLKMVNPSCYLVDPQKRDFFDYKDDIETIYEAHRMGLSPFTPVEDRFRFWDSVMPENIEDQVKNNARVKVLLSNAAHERYFNCGKIAKLPITLVEYIDAIISSRYANSTDVRDVFNTWYNPANPEYEIDEKSRAKRLLTFTEDDWVADTQHEALYYADNGLVAYTLLNNIYDAPSPDPDSKFITDHGTDLAMLFESRAFFAPFGQYSWEELSFGNSFAQKLSSIIAEFIKHGRLYRHPMFTRANWVVLRISYDKMEHRQYSAENYNFWRQTVPEKSKFELNELRKMRRNLGNKQ